MHLTTHGRVCDTLLMSNTTPEFDAALIAFVDAYQTRINTYYRTNYERLTPPTISSEAGPKYVRIVSDNGTQRSVSAFIRKADGAILKPAGWKAPFIAKGGPNAPATVRGSIYTNNGMDAVTEHGTIYVR